MEKLISIVIMIGLLYLYLRFRVKQKERNKKEVELLKKERNEYYEKATAADLKWINEIKENSDMYDCNVFISEDTSRETFQSGSGTSFTIEDELKFHFVLIRIEWFDAEDCRHEDYFKLYDYRLVEKRNMNENFLIDQEKKIVYKCYGEVKKK